MKTAHTHADTGSHESITWNHLINNKYTRRGAVGVGALISAGVLAEKSGLYKLFLPVNDDIIFVPSNLQEKVAQDPSFAQFRGGIYQFVEKEVGLHNNLISLIKSAYQESQVALTPEVLERAVDLTGYIHNNKEAIRQKLAEGRPVTIEYQKGPDVQVRMRSRDPSVVLGGAEETPSHKTFKIPIITSYKSLENIAK